MKRDLEIDLLRAFVAVADVRSFTQAALQLGRTQSAVSLQIKRLEDITGKRLLDRTRQSVSITQTGEILLVYAGRILAENDAALSRILQPEAEGLVRIGAPDDYATYLVPPILSAIAREHPRLRFEVTCDNARDLLPMLDRGQLDVVVATHPLNAVAGEVARYEPLHWVASPDYADEPEEPLALVLFPLGCVCRDTAIDALKMIKRKWRVAYSTRSVGLIERALLENAGISVMERSVIPDTLKIIDDLPGLPPLSDVAISVHGSSQPEAHISIVTDFLLRKLADSSRYPRPPQ